MTLFRWKTVLLAAIITFASAVYGFASDTTGFSFVTISDVHVPGYGFAIGQSLDEETLLPMHNQQNIRQMVRECPALEPKPSFVINCGDTGDAGWTILHTLYRKQMQPLVSAGIPVYTVVGNHDLDYAGIGRQDLAEQFDPLGPARIGRSGSRYSFDYQGCHFVIMNDRPVSGLIRFNPEDIAWLCEDLKAVGKDTRVLLFLHADLPDEDTHHVVELLQSYRRPLIFMGHAHAESLEKWGGVPVVVTGSLYGGTPKAGSYRMVTVTPDRITVRTRDFADPAVTFGPETAIEFLPPGPVLRILEPKEDAVVSGKLSISAAVNPAATGGAEYSLPGYVKWAPLTGNNGKWTASATLPEIPGRYLLTIRFTGADGAITLAHRTFIIPGKDVQVVWRRNFGAAVQAAPVLWRDRVIVPTVEGGIHALQLESGKTLWRRPVGEGQIIGRMAVEGDRVFYGAGRTIAALDPRTGKPLWKTPVEGTIIAGLTVENGKLFAPAGEHALLCLDARTGKPLWKYSVDRPIIMEASAANGRVYFGAMDGCVRALDAATGKEVWKKQVSSREDIYTTAPFWPPVVLGDKIIVSKLPEKEEKNLLALSASDGATIWSQTVSGAPLRPAASQERGLLFTLFPRGLQCLAAEDGASRWNRATGIGMYAGIVSGNRVYYRNGDHLCCVDAESGTVQWTYKTSTGPQGSYYGPEAFAVADGLVVVGTMDGRVMGLRGR